MFAYVFIDASASMGFPSLELKFLPATHVALALSYVILANHDHVKLHLLQEGSRANASPFYRGRRRMTDCVNFATSASPRRRPRTGTRVGRPFEENAPAGQSDFDFGFLDAGGVLPARAQFAARLQSRHRRHSNPVAPRSRSALSQRQLGLGRQRDRDRKSSISGTPRRARIIRLGWPITMLSCAAFAIKAASTIRSTSPIAISATSSSPHCRPSVCLNKPMEFLNPTALFGLLALPLLLIPYLIRRKPSACRFPACCYLSKPANRPAPNLGDESNCRRYFFSSCCCWRC